MASVPKRILAAAFTSLFVAACAPEGSERWCAKMQGKSMADWTAHEAKVYAENCLFDRGDEG